MKIRRHDGSAAQSDRSERKQKKSYRDLRWERLDNTAHLFPVIAGERLTNVYRISVTLWELVDPELLQQALNIVLPKFDGFNLRLRSGFFWNYFEENGKPAPKVKEEKSFPCRFISPGSNNSYLFRVSYYRYRINLEVFHVLTDGMGGMNFLKELTYQYLRLRHPELQEKLGSGLSLGTTLNREDSFLRNFRRTAKNAYKSKRAYLIKGDKLPEGELGLMHGYIPLPELKALCKSYGVRINEYLVAAFVWSVYTEQLHSMPADKPIRVAVPVNLRPFYASNTTKNFFVMISADFHPTEERYSFAQVLETVKESLRSQMNEENLERVFSYNVSNQKNPILKIMPMPIKRIGIRAVYTRTALANTSTITNIGSIEIAEAYRPYIDRFHAFLSMSKGQPIKGTVCSYGDTLLFTFSYVLAEPHIQRAFFRKLSEDGLHVEIESNGVHYG